MDDSTVGMRWTGHAFALSTLRHIDILRDVDDMRWCDRFRVATLARVWWSHLRRDLRIHSKLLAVGREIVPAMTGSDQGMTHVDGLFTPRSSRASPTGRPRILHAAEERTEARQAGGDDADAGFGGGPDGAASKRILRSAAVSFFLPRRHGGSTSPLRVNLHVMSFRLAVIRYGRRMRLPTQTLQRSKLTSVHQSFLRWSALT